MERFLTLDQYKRENRSLQHQLELKNQQIDDLNFEIQKMRKEQTIWQHLEDGNNKRQEEREKAALIEENLKLKSQIVNMANENQYRTQTIEELREKVDELKYHNQELKKLRDKSEEIHKKEIAMLSANTEAAQALHLMSLEKEKLEKKIAKCDQIGWEMEDHYLQQIQQLNQSIDQQKNVIKRMEREITDLQLELNLKKQEGRTRLQQINYEQASNRLNVQKKYQNLVYQMKERYQREIYQLRDHIKFLIVKLESMDESKNYFDSAIASSILAQSKLVMSTSSSDSFRFTPNNSFSSSIKESLSRRDTGPLKTPNKTQRHSKNLNFVLDRTNL